MFSLARRIRLLAILCVSALLVVLLAGPAAAHDPIFISADQTTPDTGPYMPDGSISWALYGSVLDVGDTRGFEFDLRDGDDLFFSLLIPNLSPETELSEDELPVLEMTAPDGTTRTIVPDQREVFDEPFSNTSYVTLYEEQSPGAAGRYQGIVTGNAPARFSVAIGINEIFFTETERSGDRPSSFAEISAPLNAWYSTPPGAEAPVIDLADGEAEIDLDMIEDAMGSGEAEAPEGSLDAPDDAEVDADVETSAADSDAELSTNEAEVSAATINDVGIGDDDDGGNLGWVAPVGGGVAALAGAAFLLSRRSKETTS